LENDSAFQTACENEQLDIVKWLVQDHHVDIHLDNELAFQIACRYGSIGIAKWLVHEHQVNIRADIKYAFKRACKNGNTEIAKWLLQNYLDDYIGDYIGDSVFGLACKYEQFEIVKLIIQYHPANIDTNIRFAFALACANGRIKIAKWLIQNCQVDINLDDAFRWACENGRIDIAKWLVQDYQINVHTADEYAFKTVCVYGHKEIIIWFIDEYRYSQSPYYYHNHTAYILNHEPLNDWLSFNILDCPIIYDGELDESAVIAYMATLKRPKSARF
jgi:hypothetical protein